MVIYDSNTNIQGSHGELIYFILFDDLANTPWVWRLSSVRYVDLSIERVFDYKISLRTKSNTTVVKDLLKDLCICSNIFCQVWLQLSFKLTQYDSLTSASHLFGACSINSKTDWRVGDHSFRWPIPYDSIKPAIF